MAEQLSSRPVDPYVARSGFRERSRQPLSIPPFAEARGQLPQPVLPSHPEWVEMYWRAWEMVWLNWRRPRSGGSAIANYLALPETRYLEIGEAVVAAQFGLYGRAAVQFIKTLDNFYARQQDDGFISRLLDLTGPADPFYPYDPNGTGPNLLAWAEWRYFRITHDNERLQEIFWPLMALRRWYRANRSWPGGLYWATGESSGLWNQPRLPEGRYHHQHWSWVDASFQAAANCYYLSQMAAYLGEEAAANELLAERSRLRETINAHLWNETAAFYQDVSPEGDFSPVKSMAAYCALLDKEIVPPDRLELFLRHLRDGAAFKRPHRVPSLSADSEGYDPETGDYWRGGVWPAANYLLLKGLHAVGQFALAHQIAHNHLDNICQVFQRTDTFWEYYAPERAAPGGQARSHYAATAGCAPIAVLLEDLIGLHVDWPQRRLLWNRYLESDEFYGVRNYPLGLTGRLDLLSDGQKVMVTTDTPFTLVVQGEGYSLQAAVDTGIAEIPL